MLFFLYIFFFQETQPRKKQSKTSNQRFLYSLPHFFTSFPFFLSCELCDIFDFYFYFLFFYDIAISAVEKQNKQKSLLWRKKTRNIKFYNLELFKAKLNYSVIIKLIVSCFDNSASYSYKFLLFPANFHMKILEYSLKIFLSNSWKNFKQKIWRTNFNPEEELKKKITKERTRKKLEIKYWRMGNCLRSWSSNDDVSLLNDGAPPARESINHGATIPVQNICLSGVPNYLVRFAFNFLCFLCLFCL